MNQKIKTAKNITLIKGIIVNFITVAILTSGIGFMTYICKRPTTEIIRNTVTFLWGCLVVSFLWYQSLVQDNLEYDNKKHPFRFLVVFIICYLVSMGMVFAPSSMWVFLAIMVVLSMFSNSVIGLTGGSILLIMTSLLSNSSNMYIFYMYFMIGLLGISYFRNLGLDFQK